MRRLSWQTDILLVALIAAGTWLYVASACAQPPAGVPAAPGNGMNGMTAGVEPMTRGPIHEAFAEPVNSGSVTPLIVPKKPPEAIDEIPPDVKPADESTIWIAGYWAWDDDRKDFIWISGVWRRAPAGPTLDRRLLDRSHGRL